MKTKHIFAAALDVSETLPFCTTQKKSIKSALEEETRARKELESFVNLLEKNLKVHIWYMGMDIIGEKNYERFIFETGGFMEIMTEAPSALNAHFVHEKQAKQFCSALKKTLKKLLKDDPVTNMFIDSIEVRSELDETLTVNDWSKMKTIRSF